MDFMTEWLANSWSVVLQAAPWMVGGFFLAGIAYIVLPTEKVTSHLGQPGMATVLKAALIGLPLPLCSCSVIPVASSLRKRGASRGATASFLISTPESGIDSIAISYVLLGPVLAVIRPLAAFVTAVVAGGVINLASGKEADSSRPAKDEGADSCCHPSPEGGEHKRISFAGRIAQAVRYGMVDMFADLSHWLILGFILAGLIAAVIPQGFLEEHVGAGYAAMLLMVIVGLPLYVCATSSTPVAAMLIAKGLSPGAALVFLLVGPATNIATMVVVGRDLGRLNLLLYLLSIVVVSIIFGVCTDALLEFLPLNGKAVLDHHHASSNSIEWLFAVALVLLMLNGLRIRLTSRKSTGQ